MAYYEVIIDLLNDGLYSWVVILAQIRLFCSLLQCLEAWEEAIPKIQRTDLDADELTQSSPKSLSKDKQ